jgi:type II secretory pathway pseudopilin PulG
MQSTFRKGSVLISVIIISCVLSILAGAIIAGTLLQTRQARLQFEHQQALNVCNSLQEYAYAYYKTQSLPTQLPADIPVSPAFIEKLIQDQSSLQSEGLNSTSRISPLVLSRKALFTNEYIDKKNPANLKADQKEQNIDQLYYEVVSTIWKNNSKNAPIATQKVKWWRSQNSARIPVFAISFSSKRSGGVFSDDATINKALAKHADNINYSPAYNQWISNENSIANSFFKPHGLYTLIEPYQKTKNNFGDQYHRGESYEREKMAYKAGLVIRIGQSKSVQLYKIKRKDPKNPSSEAELDAQGDVQEIILRDILPVEVFQKSPSAFYDAQRMLSVQLFSLNLKNFFDWLNSRPKTSTKTNQYSQSDWNGILYIEFPTTISPHEGSQFPIAESVVSLLVTNGKTVPQTIAGKRGLSIATNNVIYIQGDLNADSYQSTKEKFVPVGIFADMVGLLSNGYKIDTMLYPAYITEDEKKKPSHNSTQLRNTATSTTVVCGIIAGYVLELWPDRRFAEDRSVSRTRLSDLNESYNQPIPPSPSYISKEIVLLEVWDKKSLKIEGSYIPFNSKLFHPDKIQNEMTKLLFEAWKLPKSLYTERNESGYQKRVLVNWLPSSSWGKSNLEWLQNIYLKDDQGQTAFHFDEKKYQQIDLVQHSLIFKEGDEFNMPPGTPILKTQGLLR